MSQREIEEKLLDLRDVIIRVRRADTFRAATLTACLDCMDAAGCATCARRPLLDFGTR